MSAPDQMPASFTGTPADWARLRAELLTLPTQAELAAEAEAEWADNWDSADSDAYQARVEAGLEPEISP